MGTANSTPSNYTFPLLVAALTTWVRCVTLWVTHVPTGCHMQRKSAIVQLSFRLAKELWSRLPQISLQRLEELIEAHGLSVASGDLLYLHGGWYVTHTGLLRLARRRHCCGIRVQVLAQFCDPLAGRWVFRAATVLKSRLCGGFTGYGDADPSNVSPLVRGARNARGRDSRREPCLAQGLRYRYLLGRGDRFCCRAATSILSAREQASGASC
jgi:hypothetical protein